MLVATLLAPPTDVDSDVEASAVPGAEVLSGTLVVSTAAVVDSAVVEDGMLEVVEVEERNVLSPEVAPVETDQKRGSILMYFSRIVAMQILPPVVASELTPVEPPVVVVEPVEPRVVPPLVLAVEPGSSKTRSFLTSLRPFLAAIAQDLPPEVTAVELEVVEVAVVAEVVVRIVEDKSDVTEFVEVAAFVGNVEFVDKEVVIVAVAESFEVIDVVGIDVVDVDVVGVGVVDVDVVESVVGSSMVVCTDESLVDVVVVGVIDDADAVVVVTVEEGGSSSDVVVVVGREDSVVEDVVSGSAGDADEVGDEVEVISVVSENVKEDDEVVTVVSDDGVGVVSSLVDGVEEEEVDVDGVTVSSPDESTEEECVDVASDSEDSGAEVGAIDRVGASTVFEGATEEVKVATVGDVDTTVSEEIVREEAEAEVESA